MSNFISAENSFLTKPALIERVFTVISFYRLRYESGRIANLSDEMRSRWRELAGCDWENAATESRE